jgi:mRNA interferase YafQ
MYEAGYTKQFKKDLKKIKNDPNKNLHELKSIIATILRRQELPQANRDHSLSGLFKGYRECHILPDWLLIYKVVDEEKRVYFARTGNHSNLF